MRHFANLKNSEVFPERNSFDPENPGWAWMSNNSIAAKVGTNYEDYVDLLQTTVSQVLFGLTYLVTMDVQEMPQTAKTLVLWDSTPVQNNH